MKIALVYDWSYPFSKGGGEVRYYYLAKKLVAMGHKVTWFTLKGWKDNNARIIKDGIIYQSIGEQINAYNDKGTRSSFQSLYFCWCVLKIIHHFKDFDIIDTPQYPFFHIIPLMLYRKKVIVTWFEYWGKHWFNYTSNYLLAFIGFFIERIISKIPKNVISISNQSYTRLISNTRNKFNTTYIPNWINYSELSIIKPNNDKYDICYFGRLKGHKNVDILIKAISICKNNHLSLSLRIFGDGPEKKSLIKLVETSGLKNNVEFYGFIEKHENLLSHVRSANLFVIPSLKEGGGSIVTLEANAVGVPVMAIKSELGLDKSLINNYKNGFWVVECSPDALAKKILEVYSYIKKHRNVFYNNCKDFASSYDIDLLGERVEQIYYG